MIDVEWNGESSCKQRPVTRAASWKRCRSSWTGWRRYYGQRPIIYTAPDFYRDNLRGEFLELSVLAALGGRSTLQSLSRTQVAASGNIPAPASSHGVKGRIDLNAFNGSEEEWHNWVASRSN